MGGGGRRKGEDGEENREMIGEDRDEWNWLGDNKDAARRSGR